MDYTGTEKKGPNKPVAEHADDVLEKDVDLETSSEKSDFVHHMAKLGGVSHNPLKDLTRQQVIRHASEFADQHGLSSDRDYFIKGALLAQSEGTDRELLTEEERYHIEREVTHKWANPKMLYYLCIMCAMCAVVQGMDESVINGAQLYYPERLHLQDSDFKNNQAQWIQGLVVGAPYLSAVLVGSPINGPANDLIGRRGVIFVSCLIAAVASIWEAFTYSWVQLFLARLLLGLGIGPKSTTVPVFSAECTPAPIRGALVMMWQMWTAFGIMFGYVICVCFMPTSTIPTNTAWRLMLGSTVVAPALVCLQVWMVPESPRWYIKKNRYDRAYESLKSLRNHKIQAARDLYYMSTMIAISEEVNRGHNVMFDIFRIGRNRRALYASQLVMFMQQYCGINVIAYYSSSIFIEANFSERSALLASMGFGLVNFFFALPAVFTIDTFGRRSLLLFTFPFLTIFLLFAGFSFYIPETHNTARIACIALGIYLYSAFYSCGMGPVPFTYSAEVFPLHVRDYGMAMATFTLWTFNFVLSLTWPAMLKAFKPQGGFGFYAAWNSVGFFLVFFFMPETKRYTLEELDVVFSVPMGEFISYQLRTLPWNLQTYILQRKNLGPKEDLYNL